MILDDDGQRVQLLQRRQGSEAGVRVGQAEGEGADEVEGKGKGKGGEEAEVVADEVADEVAFRGIGGSAEAKASLSVARFRSRFSAWMDIAYARARRAATLVATRGAM